MGGVTRRQRFEIRAEQRQLGKEAIVNKKNEAEIQKPTAGFNAANFLQGTKEELDKVVWPSRQQLISESAAVLSMLVLSAILIYLIDGFLTWGAGQVFYR